MEQGGGSGGEMAEEASPISTRPPANFEELMRFSAAADDGGGGSSRGGGSSSSSSGNRWPREETLALLRIRSDMDSIFRDATLKAPLWEDVSRKLWELGYKRSAKKCKEKFENVQKYYKRTKETRGGRQDGKTYKFFTQLEALTTTITSTPTVTATLDVSPLSVANPVQVPGFGSSAGGFPSSSPFPVFSPPPHTVSFASTPMITPSVTPPAFAGVTFSSHSSSTASGMGSDEDTDMDVDAANVAGPSSRKRKRGNGGGGGKMMEFFEGLMKQVLHNQGVMQRSFLEALEKREQERLEREEAWKRQEMSRLAREQELMAQERAASASRDAAIVSLIQKITGHTIQLPPSLTQPQRPPPPQPPPSQQTWSQKPPVVTTVTAPKATQSQQITYHSQMVEPSSTQSQPIMAIPEQQIPPTHPHPPPPQPPPSIQQREKQQEMGGSGVSEQASSSRWPKAEVLTLINLRSGMEPRYQDNTPKGPLWEEIAAGMRRVGYNRNAKRCKEKWENINKYYKKVKESNKKRPEDAKTCPYFHQLDELYRNKVLGNTTTPSSTQQPLVIQGQTSTQKDNTEAGLVSPLKQLEGLNLQSQGSAPSLDNKNGEKPEDLVRELMQEDQEVVIGELNKIEEPQNYEEDDEDQEEEEEELDEEEKAAAYEIAFQRSTSRGSKGHSESTFLTMVQ